MTRVLAVGAVALALLVCGDRAAAQPCSTGACRPAARTPAVVQPAPAARPVAYTVRVTQVARRGGVFHRLRARVGCR